MTDTRVLAALALSFFVACGGKSFEVNQNEGGSDPGGTGHGGSNQGGSNQKAGGAHGGSINPGGAPPGGTGQGGGAGAECAAFNDEAGLFIAVEIHNLTQAPIHLGDETADCGLGGVSDYRVGDANGGVLPRPGGCGASCQTLRHGGHAGCPTICAASQALTLQPGEVYYTSWDGLFTSQTMLPPECIAHDDGGDGICHQAHAIEPGTFTFSSLAGFELKCADGFGSPLDPSFCQTCTPTGNGGCLTIGGLIGGELITATTKVLLDGAYGVYGALPPPTPARPADLPGGAVADQAVQIIFQ